MSDGALRRLRGVAFSKQFPNSAEPLRGTFVAAQVRATRADVDWAVIAPVPFVPRCLAPALRRPYVRGRDRLDGIDVVHPRYPVLPKRLLYLSVAPAMAAASRAAFGRFLDGLRPAFVHAHGIYPSGSAAYRLCEKARIPLVLTVHGSDLYTNLVRPSWEAEVRRTLDAAAAIVCVSSSLARDVVALAGADPARVTVVPDTFDADRFKAVSRAPGRALRLVSVGRLASEKGFDLLLDAVAMIARGGRDVSLVLVGAGREDATLKRQAAASGLEPLVRFAGPLDGERLVDTLREADVFVSASRREGFGVAILEALATGMPVVATRCGGPEDLVGPGDGALVMPGDVLALAEGIASVGDRLETFDSSAIADRAHERFSPSAVAARLLDVYASAAAGAPMARSAP